VHPRRAPGLARLCSWRPGVAARGSSSDRHRETTVVALSRCRSTCYIGPPGSTEAARAGSRRPLRGDAQSSRPRAAAPAPSSAAGSREGWRDGGGTIIPR
jgi:hypothetical protein